MVARLKRRDPSLAVISLIPEPAPGLRARRRGQRRGRAADGALLAGAAVAHLPRRADRAAARARRRRHGRAALPEGHAVPAAARRASAARWSRAARTCPGSRRPRPPRRWCASSATSSTWCSTAVRARGGQPSTLVDVSGPRPAAAAARGARRDRRARAISRTRDRRAPVDAPGGALYPRSRMSPQSPRVSRPVRVHRQHLPQPDGGGGAAPALGADAERVEVASAGTPPAMGNRPPAPADRVAARARRRPRRPPFASRHAGEMRRGRRPGAGHGARTSGGRDGARRRSGHVPRAERVARAGRARAARSPIRSAASIEAYEECWRRIRHHIERVAPARSRSARARGRPERPQPLGTPARCDDGDDQERKDLDEREVGGRGTTPRSTSCRTSCTTARACSRGSAATTRKRGPAIFRLEEHIDRLMLLGARSTGWRCRSRATRSRRPASTWWPSNDLDECYIRPLVYRGYENLGVNPIGTPVEVAVAAFPWGKYLGDDALTKGVAVKVSTWAAHRAQHAAGDGQGRRPTT